jgi:hypothetical protein
MEAKPVMPCHTRKETKKETRQPASGTGLRRLHRPRRAALAGSGEAHLDIPARVLLLLLMVLTMIVTARRLRGRRRRAATPNKPPQRAGRPRAAGADVVLGAEEEDVGGEVGGLPVGHGRGHGGRVVDGGAPAERAGGVGAEPRVDAVDVEGVAAPRQHPRRLPGRHLRDAHGAVQRLARAHLPPGQPRHGLVVEPALVAPLGGAAAAAAVRTPAAERDAQQPRPAAAAAAPRAGRPAPVLLGAQDDVEAEQHGEENRRHGRQHRDRRRDRRRGHGHGSTTSPQPPPRPSLSVRLLGRTRTLRLADQQEPPLEASLST